MLANSCQRKTAAADTSHAACFEPSAPPTDNDVIDFDRSPTVHACGLTGHVIQLLKQRLQHYLRGHYCGPLRRVPELARPHEFIVLKLFLAYQFLRHIY